MTASRIGGMRFAWVMLDWAASAFSTILITLVVAYVQKVAVADGAWGAPAGAVWAWTMGAAMLLSAVLAPPLAAAADRHGAHRAALSASVLVGSGACLALAAVPPSAWLVVLTLVVVAATSFDLNAVFTAALLPGIAKDRDADRLSSYGFAAGYAGGAVALLLATALHASRGWFGLTAPGALRAGFVVMGLWWLLFSLPAMLVPWTHAAARPATGLDGIGPLGGTTASPLVRFLLAGAILLGVVQTTISQVSSVAIDEFHLDEQALVRLVLLVQFVALPGALAIGWLSSRFSRAAATTLCLIGWLAVLLVAWFIRTRAGLDGFAVLLALVLGGLQTSIRAGVAALASEAHSGAAFGLLQVGTKLSGFVASTAYGAAYAMTGQPRAGLVWLIAQLLVGWAVLAARRPPRSPSA